MSGTNPSNDFNANSSSLGSNLSSDGAELSRLSSHTIPYRISTHGDNASQFTGLMDPNSRHDRGSYSTNATHEEDNEKSEDSSESQLTETDVRVTFLRGTSIGRQEEGNDNIIRNNPPIRIHRASFQDPPMRSTSGLERELPFRVRLDPQDVAQPRASTHRGASQSDRRVHSNVSGTARLALANLTSKEPRRTSNSPSGNGKTREDRFDVDAWMFGRMEERLGWKIR